MTNFQTVLDDAAEEVSLTLEHMLEMHDDPEADLIKAMRYAVLEGGKRIRPFLTLTTADYPWRWTKRTERLLQMWQRRRCLQSCEPAATALLRLECCP
mgnify:CR=1 FL=1